MNPGLVVVLLALGGIAMTVGAAIVEETWSSLTEGNPQPASLRQRGQGFRSRARGLYDSDRLRWYGLWLGLFLTGWVALSVGALLAAIELLETYPEEALWFWPTVLIAPLFGAVFLGAKLRPPSALRNSPLRGQDSEQQGTSRVS